MTKLFEYEETTKRAERGEAHDRMRSARHKFDRLDAQTLEVLVFTWDSRCSPGLLLVRLLSIPGDVCSFWELEGFTALLCLSAPNADVNSRNLKNKRIKVLNWCSKSQFLLKSQVVRKIRIFLKPAQEVSTSK